jgi:uncharacterized caspase-like protein
MFYLIPSDSGATDGRRIDKSLFSRWVSSDELAEWLREVDAGELAMIVDTCHSAATVEAPGFKPGPMGSRGLGQLAYDKGMRILAASQANDVALESEKVKQGLLTYALVKEGLEEGKAVAAAAQNNNQVALEQWLQYGVDRVPTLVDDIRARRTRDTRVDELLDGGTSSLRKPNAFQQPTLFDFRRAPSQVLLRR